MLENSCCSTTTSFHFVSTLERTTREGVPPGKGSPFVCQRGILCGCFILILHSTVKRSLPRFALSRLPILRLRIKSKALTSTLGTRRLFVRIVAIVVLTQQPLVSATRLSSVEKARQRTARSFKRTTRIFKITTTSSMKV